MECKTENATCRMINGQANDHLDHMHSTFFGSAFYILHFLKSTVSSTPPPAPISFNPEGTSDFLDLQHIKP